MNALILAIEAQEKVGLARPFFVLAKERSNEAHA
jgi:hypothetical protein